MAGLFPMWLHHFAFLSKCMGVQFLHISTCTCIYLPFGYNYSSGYVVASHCDFDLHTLKTTDIEHLFTGLLAICASSLVKCLFRYFAHLKIGLVFIMEL